MIVRIMQKITAFVIALSIVAPITAVAKIETINYMDETAYCEGLLEGLGIAEECKEMGFDADSENVYINMLQSICDFAGYKSFVDDLGDYPMNYFQLAANSGLTVGLEDKDLYDTLSMEEAHSLMYHALAMRTMEIEFGGTTTYSYGDTLLKERYDTELFTGIMTANTKTSLYYERGKRETVEIDGREYIASSDYDEYLGCNIDFYVMDRDGESTIIYAEPNKKNAVVDISSDSILESTTKVSITYEQQNGKVKSLRVEPGAAYIYNDVYYTNTETGYITDEDMKAENTRYVLIDNNNDGQFDVIKAEHYQYVFVSDIKVAENKIYDRLTRQFLEITDEDILTYPDGDVIDISVITDNSILGVKLPKGIGLDKRSIPLEIMCLDTTVTGTIQGIRADEITINDKVYLVNKEYMDINIAVGRSYKFYVDAYGRLLSGESSMRDARDLYAYIKKAYLLEPGEYGIIRAYTSDNGVQDYTFSEKIRFDDPNSPGAEEKGIVGFLNNKDKFTNILVKLTIRDGEVTKIELPRRLNYGEKGKKDEFNYIPSQSYFNRKGVLDDLYNAPDEIVTYSVLRDNLVVDGDKTETFAKAYSGTSITAELYNIDSEYTVGMTLRRINTKYSDNIGSTEKMFVVDALGMAVYDEDITYTITGRENGEEREYMFADGDMESISFDEGNANRRVLKPGELSRGDILQLTVTGNIINGFRVLLDADVDTPYTKYLRGSAKDAQPWEITSYPFSTDETYIGYGEVSEVNINSFKYHVIDSSNGNETDLTVFKNRPSYVYIVDGKWINDGTFSDISLGDKVFVSYIYGIEREVVIYKPIN